MRIVSAYNSHAAPVDLMVYDMKGRLVRRLMMAARGSQRAGFYRVMWDGTDEIGRPLASGPYAYSLAVGKYRKARVMLMVR